MRARPRLVFWIVLCAYGAFFPALRFAPTLLLPWPRILHERDFMNLWMAGYLTLHGRVADVFDVDAFRHATTAVLGVAIPNNYSYPPPALFVALPFGAMPFGLAYAAWSALSLGLFYVAARPLMPRNLPLWVPLLSPASLTCLLYGHYGLLYGAFWLWAFQGSGVAAALTTIKPHLSLLVAVRMLQSRRSLAIAAISTLALIAASLLAFGVAPWRAFFTTTFHYQTNLLQSYNPGRYTSMVGAIVAYGVTGQILFALFAVVMLLRRFDPFTAATATFLIVPYAYHYDMTVVCLGFAVLLARRWSQLRLWEKAIAGAAFLAPAIVMVGAWIVPPLLSAGLYLQVRSGEAADTDVVGLSPEARTATAS